MKALRDHSLREADLEQGRALYTDWRGRIEYAWDAGEAIGQFFIGLKAGKLLARRCRECERVMIPPRMFCEKCFRPTDEWLELPDTGRVNTFSVSMVNTDASRRDTAQVPVVVEIDGASPGMAIMHLLGEVGTKLNEVLERVKVGMPVQAVWKPAAERQGAITDILYFRPLDAKPAKAPQATLVKLPAQPQPRAQRGDWPVWHRYTYGVAGERFFRELREKGRLSASVCPKCKCAFLPPGLYCEKCFVEMTEHRPVEGPGTVASFTVLHRSLEEKPLPKPVVIALVRWAGVTGGWLAPLLNVPAEKVRVGMRVRPVFESERKGQVTDVRGFVLEE